MRSETFTPTRIIRKNFKVFEDNSTTAGPVVYYEHGKKYYDDSEAHIKVIGRTGKGKSQAGSLPFIRNAIIAKESFIAVDPKAELYTKTACYAEKNHKLLCIDFRNLRNSPICWNPLYLIKKMYYSNNVDFNDIACSMLSELAETIQMNDKDDPFWGSAGAELVKGIVFSLLEVAEPDQINMNSVCRMLEHFNERIGATTYDKKLYAELPENSIAKRHLSTFCNSPQDTRNSIYAICSNSLKPFSESVGLMNMISSQDTLHINELDLSEKPLAIYIIIPDEVNTYDALAGLLVSQLTQHFIRLSQDKYSRKLPNRLNIILEELGSIGSAIKNLPNLMTAARSRNIRLMLLLQSNSQLEDIYGKSSAETINASVGITIGFSTNDWATLKEWEERCGERVVERRGTVVKEPLITATQLAAMPTCTALVMVDARYKYICHFPFYDEMYDSDWKEPEKHYNANNDVEIKTFNLKEYITALDNKKRNELFGSPSNPFERAGSSPVSSTIIDEYTVDELDLDDMMKRIAKQLAELEDGEPKDND